MGISESLLNACGKETRFCRRERIMTLFRLGLVLVATSAGQHVAPLVDFYRGFCALLDVTRTLINCLDSGSERVDKIGLSVI